MKERLIINKYTDLFTSKEEKDLKKYFWVSVGSSIAIFIIAPYMLINLIKFRTNPI
jgi:hypothetical protein